MSLTDPAALRAQYATEQNLETRRSVWHPSLDGRDPSTTALDLIVSARPTDVLEVGCGTGCFAARVQASHPGIRLTAIDQSPRFVELTAGRGVEARRADVQDLPFKDDSFDVVAAMWMLYHVPDLDKALSEVRRVLRPGGLFVAVTNGDEHLAGLRRDAGAKALVTAFSSENGESMLLRHFDSVSRDDIATRAYFGDHAAALAYLESTEADRVWMLPPFEGSREYAGAVTVFAAR
ncbi:class I SAM-dependent methyltransferase [Nocardioides sp.]|uniref:class I SAM-dependent methyltransferase n=1 Tax=Nocardioides sp. TaxID=35761 RepID=UPI003D0AEF7B